MLNYLKKEANKTYTENGAVTNITTDSDCLDLFSTIGAIRRNSDEDIIIRFQRAYSENPDLAMKILFYARDIRGGLGERRVFKVIVNWLADYHAESVRKNISYFAEYGRYDDLLVLLDTACRDDVVSYLYEQLKKDIEALENDEPVSLLAKWLPSVNATNRDTVRTAKSLARKFGMTDEVYRKTLSALRNRIRIIENNLREKDYTFDYSKQPSKAMFKYRKAFIRNDGSRYSAYLDAVDSGKAKLNTGTLMPYDVIAPIVNWNNCGAEWGSIEVDDDVRRSMDVTWNSLADYSGGGNSLVVVDGSGSMYYGYNQSVMPATVALSLGMYFAERNTGAFRNHFITFSENPRLVEIKGRDIVDRTLYCESFCEIANTNIRAVFDLILNAAVRNNVRKQDMPETIYIISDMEFDNCVAGADVTNFEYAKMMYENHGYKLPQIVFWNVDSRRIQQPVTMNEHGVVLVSGCTPRIFSMVTSGDCSPYAFMMDVIGKERYASIAA